MVVSSDTTTRPSTLKRTDRQTGLLKLVIVIDCCQERLNSSCRHKTNCVDGIKQYNLIDVTNNVYVGQLDKFMNTFDMLIDQRRPHRFMIHSSCTHLNYCWQAQTSRSVEKLLQFSEVGAPPNPFGLRCCHAHKSAHISSRPRFASQPISLFAFDGSA
jgi:hypothetical protein